MSFINELKNVSRDNVLEKEMYEQIKPYITKIATEHCNGCKIELDDYNSKVEEKLFELMKQEGYRVLPNGFVLWNIETKQEKRKTYYTGISDEVICIEKKCKNNSFKVYTYLDDDIAVEIETGSEYMYS